MDYYGNAYNRFGYGTDLSKDSYEEAMQAKSEAAAMEPTAGGMALSGGKNYASTGGNMPLAAGLTALDFIQKQQAAKIANAEAQKKSQIAGVTSSTDMLNSALDRYMQAVR